MLLSHQSAQREPAAQATLEPAQYEAGPRDAAVHPAGSQDAARRSDRAPALWWMARVAVACDDDPVARKSFHQGMMAGEGGLS